jgi:hypothetical protein
MRFLMRGIIFTAFAVSLALAGPAMGQGNGNGNGHKGKSQNQTGAQLSGAALTVSLITSFERSTILGYIQNHQANPPPEFAGMKPLPPGIAKKLARGGSLPPGIAKRYFPSDLMGQLPPRPGQQWLVMGTDILLIDVATQLVLDVLHR